MTTSTDKKKFVQKTFATISGRYDFLNSLLSMRVDHYWRRVVTRQFRAVRQGTLLDLCAGTLPLSLALAGNMPARRVVAVDFCREMLVQGWAAAARKMEIRQISPVCGDGESLPLRDASVTGCTVAFGIRNLADPLQGLKEIVRVLQPGGKLVILEFSRPKNSVVKPVYGFYLNRVLPWVGGLLSGDPAAYKYLADSIGAFYEPAELAAMMEQAGFLQVSIRPLTFGIVTVYIGVKQQLA